MPICDQGLGSDASTMVETLITAAEVIERVLPQEEGIQEVLADKGHNSTERMLEAGPLFPRAAESG